MSECLCARCGDETEPALPASVVTKTICDGCLERALVDLAAQLE